MGDGGGGEKWEGAGEGFYTGYNFGFVHVQHSAGRGGEGAGEDPAVWVSAVDVHGVEQLHVQVPRNPALALRDAVAGLCLFS